SWLQDRPRARVGHRGSLGCPCGKPAAPHLESPDGRPPALADHEGMNRPYRIIVGYDGSDGARRALDRAIGLTGYGTRLTVVHVARGAESTTRGRDLLAQAQAQLDDAHVLADTVQRYGDTVAELTEAVREASADLLVLGNGKSALERL